MTKEYVCECGRTFTSPNSFNGHKSGCKEHHLAKYGNLDFYNERYKKSVAKSTNTLRNRFDSLANEKLQQWISEQHTCERCGKIMTEKYGSGRFCSRFCANSHERTEESKKKTSETLHTKIDNGEIVYKYYPPKQKLKEQNYKPLLPNDIRDEYNQNPKLCPICNIIIPYEKRFHHTCGNQACISKQISIKVSSNPKCGGYRAHAGRGKCGRYKGYYCDSTYELAYIIYNLDHNIPFKRNNNKFFYYGYKDKIYKYYPDFILEDGTFVEIKGYLQDNTYHKLAVFTEKPLKILFKNDLKYAFDYVKSHYNYKKLTDLYDNTDIIS